jgi:hypothetical protein
LWFIFQLPLMSGTRVVAIVCSSLSGGVRGVTECVETGKVALLE